MSYRPAGPFRGVPKKLAMPFPHHRDMQEVIESDRRKWATKQLCLECGGKPMRGFAMCFDCQPQRA